MPCLSVQSSPGPFLCIWNPDSGVSESVSPVVTGQWSVIQSMYDYNPGAFGCGSEVKIYEHYHPALSSIFVKSVKYRRARYSKQESLNQHETFVWQASLHLWRTLLQQMFDIGKR